MSGDPSPPDDLGPTLPGVRPESGPVDAMGAYRLVRCLGRGGFGEVHLAEHPLLGTVALKLMLGKGAADIQLFERESSLVMEHPAIPRILDRGEIGGTRFFAQEVVEGRDLSVVVGSDPLPEARVLQLAAQIADALSYAHGRDVVHRDLKPRNVLVDAGDRVWVLDFGIARIGGLEDSDGILGSPEFMAPEQAASQPIDHRADLYGLGVLIYYMASASLPISRGTPVATVLAQIKAPAVPIRERAPHLSEGLVRLVTRLLAKDPGQRPQTAGVVSRELRAIQEGLGESRFAGEVERARRGLGSYLVLLGRDRASALEEIREAAGEAGMEVASGRARPDGRVHHALVEALGVDASSVSRTSPARVSAFWRSAILQVSEPSGLVLLIDGAEHVDDGTLAALGSLRDDLASRPLLVVLGGAGVTDRLRRFMKPLAHQGVLSRWDCGPEDPVDDSQAPALSLEVLWSQSQEAEALFAPSLARARLEKHLQRAGADHPLRGRALFRLGKLGMRGRDPAAAKLQLEEARSWAAAKGDRHLGLEVTRNLATIAVDQSDPTLALELVAEASAEAEALGAVREIGACENERGLVLRHLGEVEEARACFRRAVEIWEELGEAEARVESLNNLAITHLERGELSEALPWQEAALSGWESQGRTDGVATALINLGNVYAELGSYGRAHRFYARAVGLLRQAPYPGLLGPALNNLGMLMGHSGEAEAAVELHEEALELSRRAGDRNHVGNCLDALGTMKVKLGRFDEAEIDLRDGMRMREEIRDAYGMAMSQANLGILEHERAHCTQALAHFDAALELESRLTRPPLQAQVLALRGRCLDETGERARGIESLDEALQIADRLGCRDVSAEARVHLAAIHLRGDPEAARPLIVEAIELAREGDLHVIASEAMRLFDRLP